MGKTSTKRGKTTSSPRKIAKRKGRKQDQKLGDLMETEHSNDKQTENSRAIEK